MKFLTSISFFLITFSNFLNCSFNTIEDNDSVKPDFIEIVELPQLYDSFAEWWDFNRDGYLDIFFSGLDKNNNYLSKIYQNSGNGIFVDIKANITGLRYCNFSSGDYDNDGDEDFIITGSDISHKHRTILYQNENNNSFTEIHTNMPNVCYGVVAFADYDNDNDLDIFIAGSTYDTSWFVEVAELYTNNGNNDFTKGKLDISSSQDVIEISSAKWFDVDKNGYADLILTDFFSPPKIYFNFNSTFKSVNICSEYIYYGEVDARDYDWDGDIDLLISGQTIGGTLHTKIYNNNGNCTFSYKPIVLEGIMGGTARWGDFNNDDEYDILIIGSKGVEIQVGDIGPPFRLYTSLLYSNIGNEMYVKDTTSFTENIKVIGHSEKTFGKWGDYDNDGDEDILIKYIDSEGPRISIYRNNYIN